jgi:hypothetical protein
MKYCTSKPTHPIPTKTNLFRSKEKEAWGVAVCGKAMTITSLASRSNNLPLSLVSKSPCQISHCCNGDDVLLKLLKVHQDVINDYFPAKEA